MIVAEIDRSKLTKQQLEKVHECKTAEELMALAKAEGYEITEEEAEAYLDEMENYELDKNDLDKVAGGTITLCWTNCPADKPFNN